MLSVSQRLAIYKQIATDLNPSYRLSELQILQKLAVTSLASSGQKSKLHKTLTRWVHSFERSSSMSSAMRQDIPSGEADIIAVFSEGGNTQKGVKTAAAYATRKSKLSAAIHALIWGSGLQLQLMLGILLFTTWTQITIINNLLGKKHLTGLPNTVFSLMKAIAYLLPTIEAMGIVYIILFFVFRHNWTDQYRTKYVDKFPGYKLYKLTTGTELLYTVSQYMIAGTSPHEAFQYLKRTATPWTRYWIDKIAAHLDRGNPNLVQVLVEIGTNFPSRNIVNNLRGYVSVGGAEESVVELLEEAMDDLIEKSESLAKTSGVLIAVIITVLLIFTSLAQSYVFYSALHQINPGF